MGHFSWDCKCCGHPALCEAAATMGVNQWMTKVVLLGKDGSVILGDYDGYGRVHTKEFGTVEIDLYGSNEPCLYHKACWEKAGQPKYSGPSQDSDDQGWFFNDGDHDMEEPCPTPS